MCERRTCWGMVSGVCSVQPSVATRDRIAGVWGVGGWGAFSFELSAVPQMGVRGPMSIRVHFRYRRHNGATPGLCLCLCLCVCRSIGWCCVVPLRRLQGDPVCGSGHPPRGLWWQRQRTGHFGWGGRVSAVLVSTHFNVDGVPRKPQLTAFQMRMHVIVTLLCFRVFPPACAVLALPREPLTAPTTPCCLCTTGWTWSSCRPPQRRPLLPLQAHPPRRRRVTPAH